MRIFCLQAGVLLDVLLRKLECMQQQGCGTFINQGSMSNCWHKFDAGDNKRQP